MNKLKYIWLISIMILPVMLFGFSDTSEFRYYSDFTVDKYISSDLDDISKEETEELDKYYAVSDGTNEVEGAVLYVIYITKTQKIKSYYDNNFNLIKEMQLDSNDNINTVNILSYDEKLITKETLYNGNNKVIQVKEYIYNKNEEDELKLSQIKYYNGNNECIEIQLFEDNLLVSKKYFKENQLVSERFYSDKNYQIFYRFDKSQEIRYFNKDQIEIRTEYLDQKQKMLYFTIPEFNENQVLISESKFNSEKKLLKKTIYEQGLYPTEEWLYNANQKLYMKIYYDLNKKVLRIEEFDEAVHIIGYATFTTNKEKKTITKKVYFTLDATADPIEYKIYEIELLNLQNKVMKKIVYNGAKEPQKIANMLYDAQGNKVQTIWSDKDGNVISKFFYSNEKLTKVIIMNEYSRPKKIFFFKGKNIIFEKHFDTEGNLTDLYKYIYEDGNFKEKLLIDLDDEDYVKFEEELLLSY